MAKTKKKPAAKKVAKVIKEEVKSLETENGVEQNSTPTVEKIETPSKVDGMEDAVKTEDGAGVYQYVGLGDQTVLTEVMTAKSPAKKVSDKFYQTHIRPFKENWKKIGEI